jgi:hypothetical protein
MISATLNGPFYIQVDDSVRVPLRLKIKNVNNVNNEKYSGEITFEGTNILSLVNLYRVLGTSDSVIGYSESKNAYLYLIGNTNNFGFSINGNPSGGNNNKSAKYNAIAVLYALINNDPSVLNKYIGNVVTNDSGFGVNFDQLYNIVEEINRKLEEWKINAQKEKNKRGKRNELIGNKDIKLNGLVVVGGDLGAVGGKDNGLWLTGMLLVKGNMGISGTKRVDFYFDPSAMNSLNTSVNLKNSFYRLYDYIR